MSITASLVASLRVTMATMLVCGAGYTAAILAVAQLFPHTAGGHLVTAADGTVVGSSQIAQAFTQPRYVWPRPSAVGYDAAGAGGSNTSPTSPELTKRAAEIARRYGATAANPLPAELAAASGAGLDPHVSLRAALYQAGRVAEARGMPPGTVEALMERLSFAAGGFLAPDRLVNVLEVNLALDAAGD